MNRGHLRTKDSIIPPHFLCKLHFIDGTGADGTLLVLLFTDTDGGKKRADTDSCGTEIIYLINFQTGVNLVRACENITHLICCNGIQTAAKGV